MLDSTKRESILYAAMEEFSKYGFEKAVTERISHKAGVSKGLIFRYFGSKDNLYLNVINKCIDDILREFELYDTNNIDFTTTLMKLMEKKYNFFRSHPMHYKLILNGLYNSPEKLKNELEQRYCEIKLIGYNIIMDMIKELPLKDDVSVEDILSLVSAISSIVESKYINKLKDTETSFEEYYDSAFNDYMNLIDIMLYGIIDRNKKI